MKVVSWDSDQWSRELSVDRDIIGQYFAGDFWKSREPSKVADPLSLVFIA
jgi:hypothetical protein